MANVCIISFRQTHRHSTSLSDRQLIRAFHGCKFENVWNLNSKSINVYRYKSDI